MEKPYVVGIDIGGTNTVFGVVDARGTILYSGSIKTGKYADVNDYVAELAKGLKSVIDQAGGPDKIKGVGVGAPNGNFFNGCIEFAPNLPWKGKIPLAQLISEQIDGIPVALTNDANAAAIGERTWYTDTTVLPASWATLSCVVTMVVSAVAVAKDVWRLMLQLPVWLVRLVNIWKSVRTRVFFATWIRMKSLQKTYTTQL